MDKLREIEMLMLAYEQSGVELKDMAEEFFEAVRNIVKHGIPCRELTLSIKIPYQKNI